MAAGDEIDVGRCGGGSMNATMPAKQIPVARPSFGLGEEKAVLEVLRSGWVTQGPRVAEFERKFAEYVGAPHAVAVFSFNPALHFAPFVAWLQPCRAALCSRPSILATAHAILHAR